MSTDPSILDQSADERYHKGQSLGGFTWPEDAAGGPRPSFSKEKPANTNGPNLSQWDTSSLLSLPLLGSKTLGQHQSILGGIFGAALIALGVLVYMTLSQSDASTHYLKATGQSLLQSERLAKAATQALTGNESAFADLAGSADLLVKAVNVLHSGDPVAKVEP